MSIQVNKYSNIYTNPLIIQEAHKKRQRAGNLNVQVSQNVGFIPLLNLVKVIHPSFGNTKPQEKLSIENRVVSVTGHDYYGEGLFTKDGYIDFKKVGWEFLNKDRLDWKKASNDEVMAFRHAAALAETYVNPWVKKFNYFNVVMPLSTYHTLNSEEAKQRYHNALKLVTGGDYNERALQKVYSSKESFLDKEIFDREGKLTQDFTVLDTETTGINIDHENNPKFNRNKPPANVIQLGAVKVNKNGSITDEYNQLIKPRVPIEPGAEKVHGISAEKVKNSPSMKKLLQDGLLERLSDGPIVAYNANFDVSLMNYEIREANKGSKKHVEEIDYSRVIDPFILVQRIHPYVGVSKKLTEQHKWFFGEDVEGAHDAVADVKATVNILKYCLNYLNEHYKPDKELKKEHPHLTYRDVLKFQFGEDIPGLDFKLHKEYGFDENKKFEKSYMLFPQLVTGFPGEYYFDTDPASKDPRDNKISNILLEEIGWDNYETLIRGAAGEKDDEETGDIKKYGTINYKHKNLNKFLNWLNFQPITEKDPQEVKQAFKSNTEAIKGISIAVPENIKGQLADNKNDKQLTLKVVNELKKFIKDPNVVEKIYIERDNELPEDWYEKFEENPILIDDKQKMWAILKGYEHLKDAHNIHKFHIVFSEDKNIKDVVKNPGKVEEIILKTPDNIKDIIVDTIKNTIENDYVTIWMKNVKAEDVQKGNDLPDIDIVKKVMAESNA